MISVEEAKAKLMEAAQRLPSERLALAKAMGRYTAVDVLAAYDHPLFDCSAMDGYAFAFDEGLTQWNVVGEVAAGSAFPRALEKGECVRIFTGGMMPRGSDTVVMQELVQRSGNVIAHSDVKLRRGGNVRLKGEQLRAGETAVVKGFRLNAPAIGLLASVGVREVEVACLPGVGLLVSGDEFIEDGKPAPGKIFSSNGIMLEAALHKAGIEAHTNVVEDEPDELALTVSDLCEVNDVVITTGGVSVGEHDHIPQVLEGIGAEVLFHGVAQKPGKPMLFAVVDGTVVFSLPGNPRAVLVLFLEYVLPVLRAMQGAREPWPRSERLPITKAVMVKGDRAEFRAARVRNGRVELLADEGSHMLRSLLEAEAIAYIPAEQRSIAEGDLVEVHYMD